METSCLPFAVSGGNPSYNFILEGQGRRSPIFANISLQFPELVFLEARQTALCKGVGDREQAVKRCIHRRLLVEQLATIRSLQPRSKGAIDLSKNLRPRTRRPRDICEREVPDSSAHSQTRMLQLITNRSDSFNFS